MGRQTAAKFACRHPFLGKKQVSMPRSRFIHAMKTASTCWNTLTPNMFGVLKKLALFTQTMLA